MNHIIVTGRLTAAPEEKTTQSGKKIARFSIAVDDGWRENKKTYFFTVNAWEKQAEFAGKYLRKGSKIILHGKLATRSYETQDGKKHTVTEIVAREIEFAESRKREDDSEFGQTVNQTEIPF